MNYTALTQYCVSKLVEESDSVNVEERTDRGAIQLEVRVAPNDVGKVIGRNGRVINSLRHFLSGLASSQREKVYIKIPTE